MVWTTPLAVQRERRGRQTPSPAILAPERLGPHSQHRCHLVVGRIGNPSYNPLGYSRLRSNGFDWFRSPDADNKCDMVVQLVLESHPVKRTHFSWICLLGMMVGCHCGWAYARDGQVQNRELTPSATSLRESWEYDYAYLQRLIAKRGGYAGLYTAGTEAPNVANPHSHIWASDRNPLDVQLRRTEAVLQKIKTMLAPASPAGKALSELEQQFQRLAQTAAAIPSAHGESASGAEKDLYLRTASAQSQDRAE